MSLNPFTSSFNAQMAMLYERGEFARRARGRTRDILPTSRSVEDGEMYLLSQALREEKQTSLNTSISASDSLRQQSLHLPPNFTQPRCIVCTETISLGRLFHAPCGHYYCASCLRTFVKISIKDESSFPPKCCQQPFPLGLEPSKPSSSSSRMSLASNSPVTVSYWLSDRLVDLLYRKSCEFSVPSRDRLYCPISRCSMFLGSLSTIQAAGPVCTECCSCHTLLCLRCRQIAHPGERCPPSPEEIAERQVQALAKEKKWQTCPGCKQMVERTSGCPHMVCRCRTQFCYGCGGEWGSGCVCGRPQAQPVATALTPLPRLLPPPSPRFTLVSTRATIAPREQRESWWDIEEPRVRPSFELPPLQAPPNALAGTLNRVTGMARRRLHLDNPISTLRGRSYNPFSAI